MDLGSLVKGLQYTGIAFLAACSIGCKAIQESVYITSMTAVSPFGYFGAIDTARRRVEMGEEYVPQDPPYVEQAVFVPKKTNNVFLLKDLEPSPPLIGDLPSEWEQGGIRYKMIELDPNQE